jgi:hypothetical protein
VGGVWVFFLIVILIFREFFPEYIGEAIYTVAFLVIVIAVLDERRKRNTYIKHKRNQQKK